MLTSVAAGIAAACTIVDHRAIVGPDFQVEVRGWGRSARGLRVELRRPGIAPLAVVTDQGGVARFKGLTTGHYEVLVQPHAVVRSRVLVEVRAHGAEAVQINWPETEPIRTRTLTGVLRGTQGKPVRVELVSGTKQEPVETVTTNPNGEFRFRGGAQAGLYVLRLAEGVIPVAVDPAARQEQVDVTMLVTSCGLWYSDQSECRREEIQVARITDLEVMDAAGGPLPYAWIAVSGRERMEADRNGRLGSPLVLPDGLHDMDVGYAGLIGARLRIQAQARGATAALRIQLPLTGCAGISVVPPAGR